MRNSITPDNGFSLAVCRLGFVHLIVTGGDQLKSSTYPIAGFLLGKGKLAQPLLVLTYLHHRQFMFLAVSRQFHH
ncbi:hypothetical protein ACJJI5_16100 [Microbulbifer sp. EKSA008]|uniref:hypothetical protein n=1 Tax=Microbulbifer sp. EKSA008 TaxID=3243367 RepID=UPI004043675C